MIHQRETTHPGGERESVQEGDNEAQKRPCTTASAQDHAAKAGRRKAVADHRSLLLAPTASTRFGAVGFKEVKRKPQPALQS